MMIGMKFLEQKNGGIIQNMSGSDMMKRSGLSKRHGVLVDNYLKADTTRYPVTASMIRDALWDNWGRNTPTCREIGIYLHLNSQVIRVNKKTGPAEYERCV